MTEKATGQSDFFRRDAFGNRLMTGYGNPFDGKGYSLLFTLGDLYEFRSSSTGASEERCRVRAGGRLIGELVRTSDTSMRAATFFLTDNVGSVVAEASGAGRVTTRSQRDPFGNLISNPSAPYLPADPAAAAPDGSGRMAFGDHPRDAKWGVVDMVSRFYSPRLGRFISPDKILPNAFDRTQYNAFAYVGNAPAVLRDPLGYCGAPEEEPCPLPPLPPPLPPPPGSGMGQPPSNPCANGTCDCGDHYCNYGTPPKQLATVINKADGAATCGATSSNATKTASINRSHGASGGWGTNEDGTETIAWQPARRSFDVLQLTCMGDPICIVGNMAYDSLSGAVARLNVLALAGSPGVNPSVGSRGQAAHLFGQEAFKSGIAPVGSMGNPLGRGIAGQSVLSQNIAEDIIRTGIRGADAAGARQSAFGIIDKIGTDGLKTLQELQSAFPDSRVHELIRNYRGWTSIDLVPGNPYEFGGTRLLVKRVSDGWEFMIRGTH